MDKVNVIIISLLALIVLGMIHSYYNKPASTTTTSTKTVVVKQPVYGRPYGYNPHYNAYKAQYY